MYRRRALTGAGAALAATLGGCLRERMGSGGGPAGPDDDSGANNSTDEAAEDDSAVALTDYAVSEHVVEPTVERGDDTDTWGVFLVSETAAADAFDAVEGEDADAVRTFVSETAFDDGETLLFVQAMAPQTCYALELDGEPSVDEAGRPRVPLVVTRTAPPDAFCGEAITPVSVLVRLSFAQAVPNAVSIPVSGPRDRVTRLELDARR